VILVDTPIWVDHLRSGDDLLASLLETNRVLMHPFVWGEIALGQLRARRMIFDQLAALPPARMAETDEVLSLIERASLFGSGIGYVDAHLVASVRLTKGASLWTREKRLAAVAERLSVAARVVH
jgi:predicted nucleic acid-binding protein